MYNTKINIGRKHVNRKTVEELRDEVKNKNL